MFDGLDNAYPLTPMQQGLLYEVLRQPDTDVYVAYIIIDITGDLDEPSYKKAWETAVKKHETLRTRFLWEGLDEPLQLVNSEVELDWSVESIDTIDAVEKSISAERSTPLLLSDAPPMRFRLLRLRDDFSVLVWTVHHLLADDWSTPQVLKSVANAYASPNADTVDFTNRLEFASYVEWLSATDSERHENYWQTALTDCQPTPLNLLPGHSHDTAHSRHVLSLDAAHTEAVTAACQRYGVTLSSFMHAAWALVVSRYAGTASPLFGTSVSGRTCPLPAIDSAVGLFLNTVPTVIRIDKAATVAGFLSAVQMQLFEQLEHEHLALSSIQRLLPQANGEQLFDSVLVVESHGPELTVEVPGQSLAFGNIRYVTDSNYPLTVLVFPGQQLALHLVSPPGQYAAGLPELVAQELAAVMSDLSSRNHTSVSALIAVQTRRFKPLLPPVSLTPSVNHRYIHDWITDAGQRSPEAIAVIDGDQHYTYTQLLQMAARCAGAIHMTGANGAGNSRRFVGIYLHRGFQQIAAILGVLSSGHAYVPLDPQWPQARLGAMLDDAEISLLVSDSASAQLLDNLSGEARPESMVLMDRLPERVDAVSALAGDTAYMIYTSGSSGKPKGVAISHANLIYSTTARLQYYPESPSRYLLLSSFAFDSSVAGIYWTLCTGGTLVLPGQEQERDIHELESLIARHAVTHTLCLPSLYSLLIRYAGRQSLSSLNTVIVAGEACPHLLPKQHHQTLPVCRLYNEYGPTEATVWSTVALLSDRQNFVDGPIPIGSAVPGSVVSVITEDGEPCPAGVAGEILISGPGVAAGYHRDQAVTDSRFAQAGSYRSGDAGVMDADGVLYFLGRADSQIKVRGHRIEPSEIELRVTQHALVDQAVCCLLEQAPSAGSSAENHLDGVQHLVCYYTVTDAAWQSVGLTGRTDGSSGHACTILEAPQWDNVAQAISDQSRRRLVAELPSQFTVSRFVAVNTMPLLPNGKIDHNGFPDAFTSPISMAVDSECDSSLSDQTQCQSLCALLAQLLGLESVRRSDNFFSLGGDSLAAIRFVATAREQGYPLTVPMLTRYASMGELTDALDIDTVHSLPVNASVPASGPTPLTPIQRWFFSCNQPQPAHWNMACQVQLQTPVTVERLQQSITHCLSLHPVLAAQFRVEGDTVKQLIPGQFPESCISVVVGSPEPEASLLQALLKRQLEFNLSSGDLVRFVLLADASGCSDTFGFVVHHLVTDALSNWQLAMRICEGVGDTQPNQAPGYRDWSLQLDAAILDKALPAVPQTVVPSANRWIEYETVEEHLIIDTVLLTSLRQGCQAHAVGLHECVLLGLLQSVNSTVCVDVETHGRDVITPAVDVSATIGWFSSFFSLPFRPLENTLQLADVTRFRDLFRQRREQASFDFLQDPTGFFNPAQGSSGQQTTRLLYNFLAMGVSVNDTQSFKMQPLLHSGFRAAESVRSHAVEWLVTDEIESGLHKGLRIIRRADQQVAAVAWQQEALQLLQTMSALFAASERLFSPEDFPDVDMDSDELSSFLDTLD